MMHPTKIEDFTPQQLDMLELSIREACGDQQIPIHAIFVVGSLCFGLDEVNDIDIVIHTGELVSSTLKKYTVACQINQSTGWVVDIKYEPRTDQENVLACDLGFLVPRYDLIQRTLNHKRPYDVVPFNFAYVQDEFGERDTSRLMAYMRDKKRRVHKLLGINTTVDQRASKVSAEAQKAPQKTTPETH